MTTIAQVARAILKTSKTQGREGGDVTMMCAAKLVIELLTEIEQAAQELPDYPGSGWLELIRDFADDRLKEN